MGDGWWGTGVSGCSFVWQGALTCFVFGSCALRAPQFTELVAAAVEVYMSNHDVEEFVDTLKLTSRYAMNVLDEEVTANGTGADGDDDAADGDAADGDADVDADGDGEAATAPVDGAVDAAAVSEALVTELRRLANQGDLDGAEASVLTVLAEDGDAQTLAAFEVFLTNGACGTLAVWVCGCEGVWLCGCVGVWLCCLPRFRLLAQVAPPFVHGCVCCAVSCCCVVWTRLSSRAVTSCDGVRCGNLQRCHVFPRSQTTRRTLSTR